MRIAQKVNSNIESIKSKKSEKLFYKHMKNQLKGIGLPKIVPYQGLYFDLLYIESGKAALFKFMDTNEDTFSILSEEIIEVMEKEMNLVKETIGEKTKGLEINYYFVMPFVSLEKYGMENPFIIDRQKMEDLINGEVKLLDLMSTTGGNENELLFELGKEYYIFQKESQIGQYSLSVDYRKEKVVATLMELEQIENINSLRYGSTVIEGSTGTGKTSMMIAKMIKLARIYSSDNFLYITFDKQLSNEINHFIKYYHKDINNIKVINFHQFVLILGKKYSLKLNNNSKQSFNKEFEKVFEKIAKIYKGKRYFKGVFVDEAENFNLQEIQFLREISYQTKNILCLSIDEPKRMAPLVIAKNGPLSVVSENRIEPTINYRCSSSIGYLNRNFQNDVNTFSMLELNRSKSYFNRFKAVKKQLGVAKIHKYEETSEMLSKIVKLIQEYQENGYELSGICIIYPFNEKVLKSNVAVYSKHLLKKVLDEAEILTNFADDESSNLQKVLGVTLSNIYNATNLEWKIVILCQLDTLYNNYTTPKTKDIQKMLNIIYTASGRSNQDLHIMLKDDDKRPGILDLLGQNF